jgi:hypothetical protein
MSSPMLKPNESLVRQALRAKLGPDKLEDFDWLSMLDTPSILPLYGYLMCTAVEHQDWTFWQALHEAREHFKPVLVR